ncbi:MAG: DUF4231 domain-containing protein [Bacteroidota bacterium]|nr:DUF4231 domain-containing protein [Bacteroidota bacterium]
MNQEQFQNYLKTRYNDQLDWYDAKSGFNQIRYKRWTVMVIILSAITPVLAAIEVPVESTRVATFLKIGLIAISSVVAIGTTILKTFRYQELWTSYRETAERLRAEKYLLDARLGVYGQNPGAVHARFVDQVESILSKEHSHWITTAMLSQAPGNAQGEQTDASTHTPTEPA